MTRFQVPDKKVAWVEGRAMVSVSELPALCRQEAMRYHLWLIAHIPLHHKGAEIPDLFDQWCRERFPEAAPEPCSQCIVNGAVNCPVHRLTPQPSAEPQGTERYKVHFDNADGFRLDALWWVYKGAAGPYGVSFAEEAEARRVCKALNEMDSYLATGDVTPSAGEREHPMQEIVVAKDGCIRFKANPLVRWLLDNGGKTMNDLALVECTDADRMQFAQLIGYSLSGYGELSYVTDASYYEAERRAEPLEVVPTPTEGERECTCPEDAFYHRGSCPFTPEKYRVPTPSAGEEVKHCPMCEGGPCGADCAARSGHPSTRCTLGAGHKGAHHDHHTLATWRETTGVSAGETKQCEKCLAVGPVAVPHQCAVGETKPEVEVQTCAECGRGAIHRIDIVHRSWCSRRAVGARPDDQCPFRQPLGGGAVARCVLKRGHTDNCDYREMPTQPSSCTACACERCKAREEFVRALAQMNLDINPHWEDEKLEATAAVVLAAARKVVG